LERSAVGSDRLHGAQFERHGGKDVRMTEDAWESLGDVLIRVLEKIGAAYEQL
jgi:hypothetical protein